MQKDPALATPAMPARRPQPVVLVPVQFAEATALTVVVSAPSVGPAPNAAALSIAAGPAHPGESWDDFGVARSGSALSDWPL
jgi:hypothetical protein